MRRKPVCSVRTWHEAMDVMGTVRAPTIECAEVLGCRAKEKAFLLAQTDSLLSSHPLVTLRPWWTPESLTDLRSLQCFLIFNLVGKTVIK